MKPFSFLRSLRAQLMIGVTLVLLLLAALQFFSLRAVVQGAAERVLEIRQSEINPLLSASLVVPLAQEDFATVQQILQEAQNPASIAYLQVFDVRGQLVASSSPAPSQFTHLSSIAKGTLDLVQSGQTLGRLEYGLSTQLQQDLRQNIQSRLLFQYALTLLLSLFLAGIVGYLLSRELRRLSGASQRIAGGDYNVRVPPAKVAEVDRVGHAFNAMAATVQQRVQALSESEAKQREYLQASQDEQARLEALLSAMNIGILFAGRDQTVLYSNPAFQRIWRLDPGMSLAGEKATRVLEYSANMLARPEHFSQHVLQHRDTAASADSLEIEMADGRVVTQISHPVWDREKRFVGRLWLFEDVTKARQTAEQLIYLAERDSLTGLYNRHRFQEELRSLLAKAPRSEQVSALVFFDLDEFKYVNDTFGHRAGDSMLIRVAGEVGRDLPPGSIFARLGGDEFAILLTTRTLKEVEQEAERIVRAVAQIPFRFSDQNLRLTCSVGIALFDEHSQDTEDLVAHADTAMYQSKEAGKNTWRLYEPQSNMSAQMSQRLTWAERTREALENNHLRIEYQKIVRASDDSVYGYEALVRMIDPQYPMRLIAPGNFIPLAEKTGRILDIDRWVLTTVVNTMARRPDLNLVSVNVSGRSLDDAGLPQFIGELLRTHNVDAARLHIELTETAAISDLHDARRFMEALHQLGCKICLDDFGTGFSSLSYLKHLPADILKIDGVFVRDIATDRESQIFVRAIVEVARGLGKISVAESVEDEQSLQTLKEFGVDLVQGYHVGLPKQLDTEWSSISQLD